MSAGAAVACHRDQTPSSCSVGALPRGGEGQVEGPGAREAAGSGQRQPGPSAGTHGRPPGSAQTRPAAGHGSGHAPTAEAGVTAPGPAASLQSHQSPENWGRPGGGRAACRPGGRRGPALLPWARRVSACAKHFVMTKLFKGKRQGAEGGCEPETPDGQAGGGGTPHPHQSCCPAPTGLEPAGLRNLLPVCVMGMWRRGCWVQAGLGWAPRPTAWEPNRPAQG